MYCVVFNDGRVRVSACGDLFVVSYAGVTRVFRAGRDEEVARALLAFPDEVARFVLERVRAARRMSGG